jgi:3-dehydroquinate synthase
MVQKKGGGRQLGAGEAGFHYTRNLIRIPVHAPSRSYDVVVKPGLVRSASPTLRDLIPPHGKLFLLSSAPILGHWGDAFRQGLAAADRQLTMLEMPDGEIAKKLTAIEKLARKMVASGADRGSVILALGGGVVGDVGGFLASVFMRGIPLVQVPTTLVAQVDSAIGGKTGVNLPAGKNLIGTFYQPLAVLADPEVLVTLAEREYRSGLFEAMKYGVIRNPDIFHLMESQGKGLLGRDSGLLETLIVECIKVKAAVVGADEREAGERRILNFGHTIGHALESATAYRTFLHGEAVGWGMVAAAMIGRQMNVTDPTTAERIISLVLSYGPLPKVNVNGKRVLRLLQSDKKTMGGVPHFILSTAMGRVKVVSDVPPELVIEAVEELRRISRAQ